MAECKCIGGVRDMAQPDCYFSPGTVPELWHFVEKCDECGLFEDDEAAAKAIGYRRGKWVACSSGNGAHYVVPPALEEWALASILD